MLLKPPFSIHILSTIYINVIYRTQDIVLVGPKLHQRLKHCIVLYVVCVLLIPKPGYTVLKTYFWGKSIKTIFYNSLDPKGF